MLDPDNWSESRRLAHEAIDGMFDWLGEARDRPVWQRMPDALRAARRTALPRSGAPLAALHDEFRRDILPYGNGNENPRFFGWVHGGGNVAGILGAILADMFNPNCGGRDHAGIEVEREVLAWAAEMVGMPREAAGLLVTGSSIANFIALLAARRHAAPHVRETGVAGLGLTAYASEAAHGCIARAMDMAGLGTEALRAIPADAAQRIDTDALRDAIDRDRRAGFTPFLVVGTAGTVDTGAIDDLAALAAIAASAGAWFHVDGAFGATAALSARRRPLLRGIERADSLAFDFHKWAQVPYDAGCVLIRDPARALDTFAQSLAYLRHEERGLAGNHPWPRDLGPDLSRSFRALKIWMTFRHYGADRLGAMVDQCCDLATRLAERIDRTPALERLAPVTLNVVCFRVRAAENADALNREIVTLLQERGIAAPSTTTIRGQTAIRVGIFNHRTTEADIGALLDGVVAIAQDLIQSTPERERSLAQ